MSTELLRKYIDIINEGLDPVGKEDADIDNDGDTDKSDQYLLRRRKAISKDIEEGWDTTTQVNPEERGKYAGKTKEELLAQYNALKKTGPHPQGTPQYSRMRELAFAIRAKSNWGRVE
jgi:hypothetical protein